MLPYIESFIKAIEKRNTLVCEIIFNEKNDLNFNDHTLDIPESITNFYLTINFIKVRSPRYFEVLPLQELKIINQKYLLFSYIDETNKIGFDISYKNPASEWDIVSIENDFVITKTLASYITNKSLAWIDRGRKIWKEELHDI